ncbi:MAG: protein-S-isoprenylcysteine O-methyltransferase Ste14 [Luteibaculaceae bacterium]|jgi:protein-S-isoprenylcysteine O-methyltransferase Ste14
MAMIEELAATGNIFFRYRSYIPLVMYVLAVGVLLLDPANFIEPGDVMWSWIAIGVSALGMIIRFLVIGFVPKATSGRNTKAQVADSLNTEGIYKTVRHPLYVGNYFMWLGLALYVGNVWFIITATLLYWLYYERIMFAEEDFLRNKFGDTYLDWAKNVPSFVPKFWLFKKPDMNFSLRNILKREYAGFLATFVSYAFIDLTKSYFQNGTLEISEFWVKGVIIATVVAGVLKGLKKFTRVLEVAGR